jgi:hypothetical protein
MRYRLDKDWSKADSQKNPVNDCHEMVQDSKGRILLLTNETKNNVLIYNKSGKLLAPGGTISRERTGLLCLTRTAPNFCSSPIP